MHPTRRSLAHGAAWALPVAAASVAAPALAQSLCTPAARAAIDAAFAATSNALVAYWTLDTVSQSNGLGGARPYLNINNNTPFDLDVSSTPLRVSLFAYFLAAGAPRPNLSLVATSYGSVSGVSGTTYDGHNADTWTWNAGGGSRISGNGSNSDNTSDMVFTNTGSLVRPPPGTVVAARLDSAPTLKPTFDSIKASNSSVTDDCLSYYNAKSEATPALSFSGPKLSGSTPWNNGGSNHTLPGGSTAWGIGTTVLSSTVGNYISDTYPPSARGIAYGYDGIF